MSLAFYLKFKCNCILCFTWQPHLPPTNIPPCSHVALAFCGYEAASARTCLTHVLRQILSGVLRNLMPSIITFYHFSLTQSFPSFLLKPFSLPALQLGSSSFLSGISVFDLQLLSLPPIWHSFKPTVVMPREKSVESIHLSLLPLCLNP